MATIIGEWLLTGTMGEKYTGFLHSYVSPTVMVASIAFFFVLISWDSNRLASHTKLGGVIHWVSQNTLPIYLIHMLVLESLWINVGGVWLNSMTFSPLFDVPIYAAIVFAVSSGIVYVLKKIPYVNRVLG
jgi:surface polysaccharide O-acyltransferase-like enzyme